MAQEENKSPTDPEAVKDSGVIVEIPISDNWRWEDTPIGKIMNDIPSDGKQVTIDIKEGAQLVLHYSETDNENPCAVELIYPELGIIGYLTEANIEEVKAFFNSIP